MNQTAPKKNIYGQLRLMIKAPLTESHFRCDIAATKFAYFKGATRQNSQPMIMREVNFKRNPKHDSNGYLAIEIDPVILFEVKTGIDKVQYNPNNRQGFVVFELYQRDIKGNFQAIQKIAGHWFYEGESPTVIYWGITRGVNGQSPDTHKTQQISIKSACPHTKDGAIEVAKYIVNEIKRNVKSLTAQKIRYHNTGEIGKGLQKEFDKINKSVHQIIQKHGGGAIRYPINKRNASIALSLWINMVDTNKPWDHKWQIVTDERLLKATVHRLTPRGACSHSHYHKYKKFDYFYDIWSNIHYGYVGLSVGFSKQTLLLGSNIQQALNFGIKGADTLDDVTTIKIGFKLFEEFGKFAENLTYQHVLNIIDNTPRELFNESKLPHVCIDKSFCK